MICSKTIELMELPAGWRRINHLNCIPTEWTTEVAVLTSFSIYRLLLKIGIRTMKHALLPVFNNKITHQNDRDVNQFDAHFFAALKYKWASCWHFSKVKSKRNLDERGLCFLPTCSSRFYHERRHPWIVSPTTLYQ